MKTKDPTELREMLKSLQAGEMTVSRARELIDMWLAGNYSDDQLPPVSTYPMAEDDEPMAMLAAKEADLVFLRQAVEIADGTTYDMASKIAAQLGEIERLRKQVARLTTYVEALRREKARADKAERDADDRAQLQASQKPIAYCVPQRFHGSPSTDFSFYKTKTHPDPVFAAPQPIAQAVRPLTDSQIRKWWSSENGLEDCDMCKLDEFTKVVRAVEQAAASAAVQP